MNNIFETVKASVSLSDAAARYGIEVKHHKALCPFHDDHHPSMSVNQDLFHCFVCGAGGDQITLVGMLFDLPPFEAARKLCDDFDLAVPSGGRKKTSYELGKRRLYTEKRNEALAWENTAFPELARIYRDICFTMKEQISRRETPALLKAITLYSRVEYFLSVFTTGDKIQKQALYAECREEIDSIVRTARSKND